MTPYCQYSYRQCRIVPWDILINSVSKKRGLLASLLFVAIYGWSVALANSVVAGHLIFPGLLQIGIVLSHLMLISICRSVKMILPILTGSLLLCYVLPPFGSLSVSPTVDNITGLLIFLVEGMALSFCLRLPHKSESPSQAYVASGDSFLC